MCPPSSDNRGSYRQRRQVVARYAGNLNTADKPVRASLYGNRISETGRRHRLIGDQLKRGAEDKVAAILCFCATSPRGDTGLACRS
jgi:hypothetical protein